MASYPAENPGQRRPASSPPGLAAARGPGSASVARSLAAAAAALRASEWRDSAALQRQSHLDTGRESRAEARGVTEHVYADEEEEKVAPDRRSFQQELAQAQIQADLWNQVWDQIQTQMRRPTQGQSYRDAREHDQQTTRPPSSYAGTYGDDYEHVEQAWPPSSWSAGFERRATLTPVLAQDRPFYRDSYDRNSVDCRDYPRTDRRVRDAHRPPREFDSTAMLHYQSSSYPPPSKQIGTASRPPAAIGGRIGAFGDSSDTAKAPTFRRAILTPKPAARAEAARAAVGVSSTSSKPFSDSREVTTDRKETSKTTSSLANGDSDASADASAGVASDEDTTESRTDASTTDKKPKKRVRYLRDTDRRNIIQRIDNGEKQASLAREFGVTRAAICHIKKNRSEILARYNLLVKSAQELDRTETFAGPPGVEMMVHEIRANSVLLLLTMLRDRRSGPSTFRRVAGRLIMILLEEALAILGAHPVEVMTGTGHIYRGLELQHDFCGVAIGAEGFPFLVLFHQMEPEAPQGSIHVAMATDRRGQQTWHLDHMDVPVNITEFKILLFTAACGTGDSECKAIEVLCGVGVEESSISLVVILAAAEGLVAISNRFPHVKIITGAIDAKVDRHTQTITTGFGDFVTRYNGV